MFNWIFTSPHILGCRFINNSAFGDAYTGGGGGAILDSDGANSTIVDSFFEANHASRRGGAVYADYGSRFVASRLVESQSLGLFKGTPSGDAPCRHHRLEIGHCVESSDRTRGVTSRRER